MSHYLKECPNCGQTIGNALAKCSFCGHVFEETVRQPLSESLKDLTPVDTETGQSALAYRLAAGVLLLNALLNIISTLFYLIAGLPPSMPAIVSGVIDLALAVGLFQLRPGARTWVLLRAVLGAIMMPLCAVSNGDLVELGLSALVYWGYAGSLLVLLTGESKTWRIAVGIVLFIIFGLFLAGSLIGLGLVTVLSQL